MVEVEFVHLVQHGDVLEQAHAGALENGQELVHRHGQLLVAGIEALDAVDEPAHERDARSLGSLGEAVDVELFHLGEQLGHGLPGGVGVFGPQVGEQGVGEGGDLALRREAVLDHHVRVGDIHRLLDLVHAQAFVGRQFACGCGLGAGHSAGGCRGDRRAHDVDRGDRSAGGPGRRDQLTSGAGGSGSAGVVGPEGDRLRVPGRILSGGSRRSSGSPSLGYCVGT